MTWALSMQVLLFTLVGTTALVYTVTRVYTLVSAVYMKFYCRKFSSAASRNAKCESLFSEEHGKELESSCKYFEVALVVSFFLLVFLWFFNASAAAEQKYAGMMRFFQVSSCTAYVLTVLTRSVTALSLPAELDCRTPLLKSLKKYNASLLLIAVLYTVGCWMYSL